MKFLKGFSFTNSYISKISAAYRLLAILFILLFQLSGSVVFKEMGWSLKIIFLLIAIFLLKKGKQAYLVEQGITADGYTEEPNRKLHYSFTIIFAVIAIALVLFNLL